MTGTPFYCNEPTDIPEDFRVDGSYNVVIPAGAAYLQPRFDVTAATVSAAATVFLERLMVSMPTTRDSGTDWVPGLGVPKVSLPQLEHLLPWIDHHNSTLTIAEVS